MITNTIFLRLSRALAPVLGALVLAGCPVGAGIDPGMEDTAGQTLTAAIDGANAAKSGVLVSADGGDVAAGAYWVTQAVLGVFNTAIVSAEAVSQKPLATVTEQEGAAEALTEATGIFNTAKVAGKGGGAAGVNKSTLTAAIDTANTAKRGIAVSEREGTDVMTTRYWVTQAVLDAFNSAILSAEAVSQNPAATQDDVSGAVSALTAARIAFNAARSRGSKTSLDIMTVSLTGGVSFNLRFVDPPGPGGFKYGSGVSQTATISKGYWIGETEVTQELFQAVMGVNPSYFTAGVTSGETQSKRPVDQVNWYAAIAFCNKLSLLDGKTPVYGVKDAGTGTEIDWANLSYDAIPVPASGLGNANWDNAVKRNVNGYRLPYEMEWLWAAMGGNDGGPAVTINGYAKPFAGSDGSSSIGDYAWYVVNAGSKTHEVGKKLPNELGLYDMTGNVAEWCFEPEGSTVVARSVGNAFGQVNPDAIQILRHSQPDDPAKTFHGGGWSYTATLSAIAYQGEDTHNHPSYRFRYVGFRIVRDK